MPTSERGYLRFPSISGERIVFVCEDDLWLVPSTGGRAERLTAGLVEASRPRFSPDGRLIAFVGKEEGPSEVFVMPSEGGRSRRLTFQGALVQFVSFMADGAEVVYSSNAARPLVRQYTLQAVALAGGLPRELGLGPASSVSFGPNGKRVLSRQHVRGAHTWKRYRGGTAGTLWEPSGAIAFQDSARAGCSLALPSNSVSRSKKCASALWLGEAL